MKTAREKKGSKGNKREKGKNKLENCAWAKEMLAIFFRARSTPWQPLKTAEAAHLQREKLGAEDLQEETAPIATGRLQKDVSPSTGLRNT